MRHGRSNGAASNSGDCAGKKRYPHQRAAREAAQIQMQHARNRDETLDLRVYRCENARCKGWHLTEKRHS